MHWWAQVATNQFADSLQISHSATSVIYATYILNTYFIPSTSFYFTFIPPKGYYVDVSILINELANNYILLMHC